MREGVDDEFTVLHTLRCAGTVPPERVAGITGLEQDRIESVLIDLGVQGWVRRETGPFGGGWTLTADGHRTDAEWVADELWDRQARGEVERALRDFTELNPVLLDLCSAWQLRPVGAGTVLNDHSDPGHDARILAGIDECLAGLDVVLDGVTPALPRFDRYGSRLHWARERVAQGELSAVADDLESIHTIWFQLHEDLLVTLGLTR